MIPKLNEDFKSRVPLVIRRRNGIIYYQVQIDVARDDGLCAGRYCEYSKSETNITLHDIGQSALRLLERFHQLSDLSESEFYQLKGITIEQYKETKNNNCFSFFEVKDFDELYTTFEDIALSYDIKTGIYHFFFTWTYKCGNHFHLDHADSTGTEGVLTFNKPLEFNDSITPEELGSIIEEAFLRRNKLEAMAPGNFAPVKKITLNDGSVLTVKAPKNKKFADYSNIGFADTYQVFSYIANYGDTPSAEFIISSAPELHGDLNCDNIRLAWCEAYDKAELLEAREIQYGIYNIRAEMRSSKSHRIAYFSKLNSGQVLECCMNVKQPNKRKKLDEKLSSLFETFALNCKF